jgi:hypothetical protein
VERNPREVRFRVFHKDRMRFDLMSRRPTMPGLEIRKDRVRQPSLSPIDDAPRSGESSFLLKSRPVLQDIFFQIEVLSLRHRFRTKKKSHARVPRFKTKPERAGKEPKERKMENGKISPQRHKGHEEEDFKLVSFLPILSVFVPSCLCGENCFCCASS